MVLWDDETRKTKAHDPEETQPSCPSFSFIKRKLGQPKSNTKKLEGAYQPPTLKADNLKVTICDGDCHTIYLRYPQGDKTAKPQQNIIDVMELWKAVKLRT